MPEDLQNAFEQKASRFIVGIDLGTTNCAVAWIDMESESRMVATFPIEQLVDWGTVEKRDTLPSFHYQLTEIESHSTKNRWIEGDSHPFVVGALARDRGLEMPGRQIASAKSWLCHHGVDRTAAMLPWQGDSDVALVSPVTASSFYLSHIRKAWNQTHPNDPLELQEVVITLPASFDEIARGLTIEAAKQAGLPKIILLEEPQAAFYAWLSRHGHDWSTTIRAGQSVLVCDIGGGTTDLTLIRVKEEWEQVAASNSHFLDDSTNTKQKLHRVAVGEHLILGGDNLDLALAKAAESRLTERGPLSIREWDSLRAHCRVAKEQLLGSHPPNEYRITLVGSGSKLIQNTKSVSIDQKMVQDVLLDGFFPLVGLMDRPKTEHSGFQEFGLPYAQDAAITRHLAHFLWEHRFAGRDDGECSSLDNPLAARPDFILFNGGVLEAEQIRQRILNQITIWFNQQSSTDWQIEELKGNRLDLAVAHGAAYFGLVRRGEGVRIDASLARSYYLQISDHPPKAICLMPGDSQPGNRVRLTEHPFELRLGEPVQFPLWVSSLRLTDRAGSLVELDTDHHKPMPPIRTVLESSRNKRTEPIPVIVEAELSEIGTLQLACEMQDQRQRWQLDFDIRSAMETDRVAHQGLGEQAGFFDQSIIEAATEVIGQAFGKTPSISPGEIVKRITQATGLGRSDWPPSLLRRIWSSLIEHEQGRRISPQHEARWLNLVGYSLRPGYGFAADDWRVATTWRKVQGKLQFRTATSASEAIILWRRIAGGFTQGQQQALFQEILPRLKGVLLQEGRQGLNTSVNETIELFRLTGSLELLSISDKTQLAKWILAAIRRPKSSSLLHALLWTLGRIGCRIPMYGPIHLLIPSTAIEAWIDEIIQGPGERLDKAFTLLQIARRTGDRYRDLREDARSKVLTWMLQSQIPEPTIVLVREVGELSLEQQSSILGESVPLGLHLRA